MRAITCELSQCPRVSICQVVNQHVSKPVISSENLTGLQLFMRVSRLLGTQEC
jgi:hypothetical protein